MPQLKLLYTKMGNFHFNQSVYSTYCMKPCKMKVPNCTSFAIMRKVRYPLENIVPACIQYNKPVFMGKYCTWTWSQGKFSTQLCLMIMLYKPLYCTFVYPVVHSMWYFN